MIRLANSQGMNAAATKQRPCGLRISPEGALFDSTGIYPVRIARMK